MDEQNFIIVAHHKLVFPNVGGVILGFEKKVISGEIIDQVQNQIGSTEVDEVEKPNGVRMKTMSIPPPEAVENS